MVVSNPVNPSLSVGVRHLWGDLNPEDTPDIQTVWRYEFRPGQSTHLYTLSVDGDNLESPLVTRVFSQKAAWDSGGFRTVMLSLAKSVAPRLYEHDPRTGLGITLGGAFPVSPLFDRPDYNVGLNAQLFTEKDHYEGERCPFCSLLNDDASLWAGGNVGWAHTSCTPWIAPRTWKLQ